MQNRRLLNVALIVVTCCALPAWAAWSGIVTMGTTVVLSDPSCASPAVGKAVCAARSVGQTLVVNQWSGTTWSGWKPVAGTVTSNPSCASDAAGKVVCAARNDKGGISATIYNGTAWSALTNVGGQITFEPSCATLSAGKVLCVARNTIGGITSSFYNGTTWSPFKTLKGSIVTAPGCGSDGTGVVCLATSTTQIYNVVAARFNGTAWSAFINIGGSSTTDRYSCTPFGGTLGPLSCFARSTGTNLFVNDYKGGAWAATSWTGWFGLGGTVNAGTSCSQVATGQLACGAVASDAGLWVNSFNGTSWLGWSKIGTGLQIGNPGCTSIGASKVLCAVVGLNGKSSSVVGP